MQSDPINQFKRGVQQGVAHARRAASAVSAEARIFALHRKIGLRAFQLWRGGQLSHPDLQADFEELSQLEETVDAAGEDLTGTRAASTVSVCPSCKGALLAGAKFCTLCGSQVL